MSGMLIEYRRRQKAKRQKVEAMREAEAEVTQEVTANPEKVEQQEGHKKHKPRGR